MNTLLDFSEFLFSSVCVETNVEAFSAFNAEYLVPSVSLVIKKNAILYFDKKK